MRITIVICNLQLPQTYTCDKRYVYNGLHKEERERKVNVYMRYEKKHIQIKDTRKEQRGNKEEFTLTE